MIWYYARASEISDLQFSVSSQSNRQTHVHMHVHNEVALVWAHSGLPGLIPRAILHSQSDWANVYSDTGKC